MENSHLMIFFPNAEGDYMRRMRGDDSIGPDLKMAAGYIPVVIEIFTDGLAAFNKAYHSEWAIMMKILNLPPWVRYCPRLY